MPALADAAHESVDAPPSGSYGPSRPALVAGVVHEERQVGVGRRGRADVDRRRERVAAGQALVHGDDRRRRCRRTVCRNARADRRRGRIVVVEEPPVRRVRVHLPRAQVVGRRDLGHRRQRRVERTDVGHGMALDEHPAVTAELVGQRPAPLHRLDRRAGRRSPTDRASPRSTATAVSLPAEHEVAPVLGREAVVVGRRPRLREAAPEAAGLEEVASARRRRRRHRRGAESSRAADRRAATARPSTSAWTDRIGLGGIGGRLSPAR